MMYISTTVALKCQSQSKNETSIIHVAVDQKRLLVRFGLDAVETARWFQSVKQLGTVWADIIEKALKTVVTYNILTLLGKS